MQDCVHVISEEFEERIDVLMGYPTTDPHGAPIPTRKGDIEHETFLPLSRLQAGQTAVVRRVDDQNPEILRHVEDLGLKLGTQMEIRDKAPFNGPLLLQINAHKDYSMGLELADHIFVQILEE